MATQDPPAPADLLVDAVQNPDAPPLEEPQKAQEVRAGNPSAKAGAGGTSGAAVKGTEGHEATTTITTVPKDGGDATTQTFTHVGADSITANYSSSTNSITLRPIPVKGLSPSSVRTLRSKRTHFTPRISHFDRDNTASSADPFRGFWTLFWLTIFMGGVRTSYRHFVETGEPFGRQFATLISEDGWALALSDGVMVAATGLCVVYGKLLINGWIRYYYTGLIVQHVAQTAFLGIAVRWTFHRNWPWVQSGFMTLHALSLLMKVHSYCATVGELSERSRQLKKDTAALDTLLPSHGGRATAEREARAAWEEACKATPSLNFASGEASSLLPTPSASASASATTSEDESTTASTTGLRHRPAPMRRHPSRSPSRPNSTSVSSQSFAPPPADPSQAPHEGPETLSWHPSTEISDLAIRIAEANEALSSESGKARFPENVTWGNFVDYLLVPTLVYELEYPRQRSIRPLYILEKTLATFGTFWLLIGTVEHYVLPFYINTAALSAASLLPPPEGAVAGAGWFEVVTSFASNVLDLALPFCVCYLLIFFIIFECILNVFAEVTRFSDRAFYSDWWNSISFDEFSRKWNRPVHTFLLRHVYATTISTYRLSKFSAAFVTFLLSALVHELVMAVVTKKIRLYLFVLQMAQLPLIMIGRAKIFRRYPALGNLFFWIGLLSGFPILAVAYLRY